MKNNTFAKAILPLALLCLSCFGLQAQTIRLGKTEMTVRESIDLIRSQTNFRFTYNTVLFPSGNKVTYPSAEVPIDGMLRQIAQATEYTYVQQGHYIVFTPTQGKPVPAPQPIDPLPTVSRFGEVYASTQSANQNANRRRPVQAPVIEIVDQTEVVMDTLRSTNTESYSSFIVPLERYANNPMPKYALKINLLYGLGTLTPNLAFEIGTGRKTSFEFSGSYNGWKLSGSHNSNKKLVHMILRPEFRWWMCERFDGHFFGVHAFYGRYNISTHEVPLLFKKENRYDGHAFGAGFTYGYHWMLDKHWGIEFNVGVGAAYLDYDRFDCAVCDYAPIPETKWYFGPTRAGITLVYNF